MTNMTGEEVYTCIYKDIPVYTDLYQINHTLVYTMIYFACLVQVSISGVTLKIIVYTSIYSSYEKMTMYVL
jgi:hypothetical protein